MTADRLGKGGRTHKLREAEITAARQKVGAVVCVKAQEMTESWHSAASDGALSAAEIVALYSKRWTIEPNFRDTRNLNFGVSMNEIAIGAPQRCDRLLLLNVFAMGELTSGHDPTRNRHIGADAVPPEIPGHRAGKAVRGCFGGRKAGESFYHDHRDDRDEGDDRSHSRFRG